jgi:hypothetical protein
VPAERADNPRFLAVDNGDVVSKVMKQRCVVATIQPDLHPAEHPYEDVPEQLRFAVLSFLFFGHGFLQKDEAPAGMNTDRGFYCEKL